jgi:hypothetical protein
MDILSQLFSSFFSQLFCTFPGIYQISRYLNTLSTQDLIIYFLAIIGVLTSLDWFIRKVV